MCNITPCSPHLPMYSPTSWPLPHGITSSFAYFESIQKYLSVGIYFIDQMLAFVRNHTMFSSSPPLLSPISQLPTSGITSFFAYSESTQQYLSVDIYFIGPRWVFVQDNTMFSSSPPRFSSFLGFKQTESLHSLNIRNLLKNTYPVIYIT